MPGRAIGNQRVPSFRAPAFGNPLSLHNKVRNAAVTQVLAHGHAGLARTNNEHLDFFSCHILALFRLSGISSGLAHYTSSMFDR
jgi:hypothetical protein